MKVCPSCGNRNLDQAKFCDACGASLESGMASVPYPPPVSAPPPAERAAPAPPLHAGGVQSAPEFPGQSRAVLRSEATGETFVLQPEKEAIIGRGDPARGLRPDITLNDDAALAQGVSRLHAKVIYQGGTFYLVDLNSTNSTYINGNRLVPQQFYSLRDGDTVELGKYRMRFALL